MKGNIYIYIYSISDSTLISIIIIYLTFGSFHRVCILLRPRQSHIDEPYLEEVP